MLKHKFILRFLRLLDFSYAEKYFYAVSGSYVLQEVYVLLNAFPPA